MEFEQFLKRILRYTYISRNIKFLVSDKDKLFVSTNDELNRYCQSIATKNLCNPPYKDLTEEKKEDMCCVYNDKNIHKTTIHKFDYNVNIPSRDKSFIFKF